MENLFKIRTEKGLSQTDIANQLHVARNTVSQWEMGKREPDYLTLKKLSKLLHVSIDYLLGNESENTNILNVTTNSLSETQTDCVKIISQLNERNSTILLGYLQLMLSQQK